ncbi:DUF1453 domain-containing protein [Streptomyces sp. NBC_00257]|uniref:DUF1453 domain-containing protein n=1 Tax=unclassified Streptomyces TaxID=2593676 RepID=UPI00225AFAF4|nr:MULTISPECIES: DUF1453 domain-containing protein [unclassified Streptomyces]MCX5428484.1 DUF1453 domain-containing protein [Streptomyces sp. NBC_00062]
MSGLVNVLVIGAVIAVVVFRQCSAQQITDDRRWWVLPGILLVLWLREPGLVDPHHAALSAAVLGAEMVVGLVTGAGWAWTTRLWHEADGSLWSKGTKATAFVWTGGLALRAALYGVAALMGIHQGTAALLAALAVMLAARGGALMWRAGQMRPAYGDSMRGDFMHGGSMHGGSAYGGSAHGESAYGGSGDRAMSRPAWKDRV